MKTVKVSEEAATNIQNRKRQLVQTKLEPQDLISALREWETRPTIAAKRILSMLAILSSTAFIVGVDYADIPFLGVPQGQGGEALSFILFAGIALSGFAYLWNRSIDLRIRKFEFLTLRKNIEFAHSCVDSILETLEPEDAKEFPNIRITYYHKARKTDQPVHFQCKELDTILLYRQEVKDQESKRGIFERAEVCFLVGLALLGMYGLLKYWDQTYWT